MLASSYITLMGPLGGAAPSLTDLLAQARARAAARQGRAAGFGATVTDYDAFLTSGGTYKNAADSPVDGTAAGIVSCFLDRSRPTCALTKFPAGAKARSGPVAALQRAVDAFINKLIDQELAGTVVKGAVPTGDGETLKVIDYTFPALPQRDPIGRAGGGYDGILGPGTLGPTEQALALAGLLEKTPEALALAVVSIDRPDIKAMYAAELADYLNEVTGNFEALLQAFKDRGDVGAQTVLDVKTIPGVVPTTPPAEDYTLYYVIGGVALAAAVGGGIYYSQRKKKEAAMSTFRVSSSMAPTSRMRSGSMPSFSPSRIPSGSPSRRSPTTSFSPRRAGVRAGTINPSFGFGYHYGRRHGGW